ncbi:acetyltransferase, GNAT family protein [Planococcus antarcticus DSM 14505]|uniref:Acetyltransferase, GNAT family protein n=1 Tax=Planococcus antarcticus DSM 14505 TaxID=1185653 RepID=A0A1C7DDG2_9BACL|nr:GNAT family N-acetyltransferase [Planococcus antarcticus]ANU09485.1 GNAT family N-acetyltransferase [Planococcus antarcticus DSM 14505]EIM06263.1 acetyltransferase, GNAT family protein [Planococcus antarcticus DSM 14505]
MKITLEMAVASDAAAILAMQKSAFLPLLKKYQDSATNPANETLERVLGRISGPGSFYYKIMAQEKMVGAIRIKSDRDCQFWVSPLFVDPLFQGLGIAGRAMKLTELLHAEAATWELATILEEEGNCRFYEKLGYRTTGVSEQLNDRATLGYFKKIATGVDK